mmetsp:Transcript_4322/g.15225  ORF Transcript_4322/g.15225 Transcript_4322/m.15225 type:complete len:216 (+) Transcript_4322:831-1478(+)
MLHRAFSVFLFDRENRLLHQQRASSKITFPSLWTTTCCSHPLYGCEPGEVDTQEDIASGAVPGAKRAAVRKLFHELGIPREEVPMSKLKYLTRLHYRAADEFAVNQSMTGGPSGDHERDFILFVKPAVPVTISPNPDEVDDVKWVNRKELRAMMDSSSGLWWSPWYRIICDKFLDTWWDDLERTIESDAHVDLGTIHKVIQIWRLAEKVRRPTLG